MARRPRSRQEGAPAGQDPPLLRRLLRAKDRMDAASFQYTPTRPGATNVGLEAAHASLHISPAEFDAVAAVLARSLDHFHVPAREKQEVLAAFAAHKEEVTRGSRNVRPGN